MEITFGGLAMPQDWGPIIVRYSYSLSIALRDRFSRKCLPSNPPGALSGYIPSWGKKIHDDEKTTDRSHIWDHLHRNTMHRLHQANYRLRRLCSIEVC